MSTLVDTVVILSAKYEQSAKCFLSELVVTVSKLVCRQNVCEDYLCSVFCAWENKKNVKRF